MYFSEENIKQLEVSYAEVEGTYQSLLLKFGTRSYEQKEAAEFAVHGFTRRVTTMKRCIDNIYRICPPNIDRKLSTEELSDLAINLQAFVLNVYGSLDNLAWVWVKEKGILNKKKNPLTNGQIGFAEKYTYVRDSFPDSIREYLNTEQYKKWFSYIADFRHSLAHRIPLYVPPSVLNNEETLKAHELKDLQKKAIQNEQPEKLIRHIVEMHSLGKFVPWMTHSFGENSPQAVFHAQIIADWNTVMQISEIFIIELDKKIII